MLVLLLALACLALDPQAALAHIPRLTVRGPTLATAILVNEPATSWVYYGRIERAGDVWYYRLPLRSGERIRLQLITPDRQGFAPGLVLAGPGLVDTGSMPAAVEIPENMPAVVVEGRRGAAEFEPFTPGAYFYPATLDVTAPQDGTYYAAVFAAKSTGAFGLAIGYEERYTVPAWVRLPADLLRIYAWDGGWASALAAGLAVIVLGAGSVWWRDRRATRRRGLGRWLAITAGLMYLATTATLLVQLLRAAVLTGIVPAMLITAVFIAASLIMGGALLRFGRYPTVVVTHEPASHRALRARVILLALGLAGFALLSGYLLGPVLAVAAAAAPPYRGATGTVGPVPASATEGRHT